MGVLIDSSVLINLERRGEAPATVRTEADTWAISAVTVAELLFGIERATTNEQHRRRQAFIDGTLDAFPVLPFDVAAARVYATLWAELSSSGLVIGTLDFMIAATALANNHALLTDNVREFGRIPGLQLLQPDR